MREVIFLKHPKREPGSKEVWETRRPEELLVMLVDGAEKDVFTEHFTAAFESDVADNPGSRHWSVHAARGPAAADGAYPAFDWTTGSNVSGGERDVVSVQEPWVLVRGQGAVVLLDPASPAADAESHGEEEWYD